MVTYDVFKQPHNISENSLVKHTLKALITFKSVAKLVVSAKQYR